MRVITPFTILSVLASAPAYAHEGAGGGLLSGIAHLITEPEHLLVVMIIGTVAYLLTGRKRIAAKITRKTHDE